MSNRNHTVHIDKREGPYDGIELEVNASDGEIDLLRKVLKQQFEAGMIVDYGIDQRPALTYNEAYRRITEIGASK